MLRISENTLSAAAIILLASQSALPFVLERRVGDILSWSEIALNFALVPAPFLALATYACLRERAGTKR